MTNMQHPYSDNNLEDQHRHMMNKMSRFPGVFDQLAQAYKLSLDWMGKLNEGYNTSVGVGYQVRSCEGDEK